MCSIVSEPIALQLRQQTGNIYLHAQIYAGFMYVGAASCMWLLRAWKIGELEAIAAYEDKALDHVKALGAESSEFQRVVSTASYRKSSVFKRLVKWKKV